MVRRIVYCRSENAKVYSMHKRCLRVSLAITLVALNILLAAGIAIGIAAPIYRSRDYKRELPQEDSSLVQVVTTAEGTRVSFSQAFVKSVEGSRIVARAIAPHPSYTVEGPGSPEIFMENAPEGGVKDTDPPFTFAYIGDTHNRLSVLEQIATEIEGTETSFVCQGGDLVHHGSEEEYARAMISLESFNHPFFALPGNHDLRNDGYTHYMENLGPLRYFFDFSGVRFVFFGTMSPDPSEGELDWLEGALQGEYIVVFTHIPPVDPWGGMRIMYKNKEAAEKFMNLMLEKDVDLVCCSHFHDYKDFEYRGVHYLISGGAGGFMLNPRARYHYVLVDFDGEEFIPHKIELEVNQRSALLRWTIYILSIGYFSAQRYFAIILLVGLTLLAIDVYLLLSRRKIKGRSRANHAEGKSS